MGTLTPFMQGAWGLFLVSFVALFIELALIRWIPTRLRLLAYFSNFILIAALLGLGLGMIIAGRWRRTLQLFPFGFVIFILLVVFLERSGLVLPLATESNFIWNGLSRTSAQGPLPYILLVGFFALTAIVFVPLGQEIALQLQRFRPIAGYSINIVGSLAGVVGFALISYLRWPPVAWFGLGSVAFLIVFATAGPVPRCGIVAAAILLGVGLIVIAGAHRVAPGRYLWSPYYEIRVEDVRLPTGEQVGFKVAVNRDSHQEALDLSDDAPASEFLASRRHLYDLPYTVSSPADVLILGAGTGNDVAAALRAGAARVDAVEIDPVIAELGELHPERPYADSRVQLYVDDARSFLQKSEREYDLVVFGFLDSHRLFSSMSSVRLDNYMYTVENIENVRRHLGDDGLLALTFTVHEKWIADRLFSLLSQVFGHEPTVYQGNQRAWGTTFLIRSDGPLAPAGPIIGSGQFADEVLSAVQGPTWAYSATDGFLDSAIFSAATEVPTDDWPYLYMQSRRLPGNYVAVLLFTFVVAVLLIRVTVRRTGLARLENWNFLFLGVAFALLETKGITNIALLFGSTWITSSVVIASILLMILLANLLVLWAPSIPLVTIYGLLAAVLLFSYFFSLQSLLGLGYEQRLLLAGLQVSLPLLFAGVVFASHFRYVAEPGAALGANLIGAMVGGLLEYSSLLAGQRALFLVALAFYMLSAAVVMAARRTRLAPAT